MEVSRSGLSRSVSQASSAPKAVLFMRRVGTAGVAASVAVSFERPLTCGEAVEGQRGQAQQILSVLRSVDRSVSGVASQSVVASEFQSSAFSSSVASEYPSAAYSSAKREAPVVTLPLVIRSLMRRAAAAKVSRGRRRLGLGPAVSRELRSSVAFVSVQSKSRHVTSVALRSVESVEFGCVASRSVASSAVASSPSASPSVGPAFVELRLSERQPRVVN